MMGEKDLKETQGMSVLPYLISNVLKIETLALTLTQRRYLVGL